MLLSVCIILIPNRNLTYLRFKDEIVNTCIYCDNIVEIKCNSLKGILSHHRERGRERESIMFELHARYS